MIDGDISDVNTKVYGDGTHTLFHFDFLLDFFMLGLRQASENMEGVMKIKNAATSLHIMLARS